MLRGRTAHCRVLPVVVPGHVIAAAQVGGVLVLVVRVLAVLAFALAGPTAAAYAGIRECLDRVGVVRTERFEDFREGAVGVGGEHVVGIFVRSEEYRDDQRGDFPLTGFHAEGASDHLHDVDHRPPRVTESDRVTIRGIDYLEVGWV
ncbi:hypothetical protein BG418_11865 [Streptomyces sp. CBMA152]|nr:hypothetical protein [Streptomyces sp. CBMA152]